MSFTVIKTFRIKKRLFILLFLLFLLSYLLSGVFSKRDVQQEVAVLSWAVANKIIIIDPGYGGLDPGLKGNNGYLEKEISVSIANNLAVFLRKSGAMVLMTEETGSDFSELSDICMSTKNTEDLKKRGAQASELKPDLYIRINVNSYPTAVEQTFGQSGFPNSKLAGQSIHSELSAQLKNIDWFAKEVDYYLTGDTIVPAVLVKTGFITDESRLLLNQDHQNKVAWAIYAGIVKYFYEIEKTGQLAVKKEIINVFKEQEPDLLREP
ncbi:MAG: N-acetylmuramoyl-L-alanine amidase [Desulfotomaculaceae bacterium]|nr:N-acetylmuramoyl-L-alanine amidase [Desulfotomaculaceae bacterium]